MLYRVLALAGDAAELEKAAKTLSAGPCVKRLAEIVREEVGGQCPAVK